MYNDLYDKNIYDKRQQAQLLSPLSIKMTEFYFSLY